MTDRSSLGKLGADWEALFGKPTGFPGRPYLVSNSDEVVDLGSTPLLDQLNMFGDARPAEPAESIGDGAVGEAAEAKDQDCDCHASSLDAVDAPIYGDLRVEPLVQWATGPLRGPMEGAQTSCIVIVIITHML